MKLSLSCSQNLLLYLLRKNLRTIFLSFSHCSLHSPFPSPISFSLHIPFLYSIPFLSPLLPFPLYCIRPSPLLPLSDPLPQGIIPPLVVQCVGYINRDSVLREPGLFRIPGDVATIRRIRSDFVRGVSCVCESAIESHLLQHIWPRGCEDD